jgi:putative ABC transport system permease protein
MALPPELRSSLRVATTHPGFSLAVILTLALGIAASAAVFAVVHGVLLRPLPFAQPERLVTLANTIPAAAVPGFPFSISEYTEHRDRNPAFAGLAVYAPAGVTLTGPEAPERLAAARVSANFFDVLGVRAALGRTFVEGEDQPGARCGVVLRDGYWRSRFGAAAGAIGQSLIIDDAVCRVVGIAPADFRLPATADAWLTARLVAPAGGDLGRQSYRVIGRLAEGVSVDRAVSATRDVARRFYERHPGFYSGAPWRIVAAPLSAQMLGDVSSTLVMLSAAVALMLAIACANVAQLMLGRLIARDREFAIRAAMGAGRVRLFAHVLAEAALLAAVAGALGLWLASVGVDAVLAAGLTTLPRQESIHVDGVTVAVALAASLVLAVAVAAAAIPRLARAGSGDALRQGRSGPGRAARRLREGLVAVQVGLTMVLVVGAMLLAGSLERLSGVPPGFAVDHRLVAQVTPPASRYPDLPRAATLLRTIAERVSALPGVIAAGSVSALPLGGHDPRAAFSIEGWTPEQAGRTTDVHHRMVSGEYFRAVGMRLAAGRWPSPTDGRNAPPIVVVNESFARRFWNEAPLALGHRVTFDRGAHWYTIAGVAADVKHLSLDADNQIEIFVPYEQATTGTLAAMTIVVHAGPEAGSLAEALRTAVAAIDPRLPLHGIRTLDEVVSASMARPRLRTTLTGVFAVMGLLLAGVGTFSVFAQFVRERAYEIAVRRALGAPGGAILGLTLGRGVRVLAAGMALGVAGSLALSGSLRAQLFGISPTDLTSYLLAAATLTVVGLLACVLPARRAVRVDPLNELRTD